MQLCTTQFSNNTIKKNHIKRPNSLPHNFWIFVTFELISVAQRNDWRRINSSLYNWGANYLTREMPALIGGLIPCWISVNKFVKF
jgi:hypothetical protein